MRFTLKIVAFTALLLISKFTKEDKLVPVPAATLQPIVTAEISGQQAPVTVHKMGGNEQHEPVQTWVAAPATIK